MARRNFIVREVGSWFGVEWPRPQLLQPMSWEVVDYYRDYVLVCPVCGEVWCRSTCEAPDVRKGPDWASPAQLSKFDVRTRHCELHMEAYVGEEMRWRGEFVSWQPTCSPGSALSIAHTVYGDFPPTPHWELMLRCLPEPMRQRELRLWARLDSLLNPHAESTTEPAPDTATAESVPPLQLEQPREHEPTITISLDRANADGDPLVEFAHPVPVGSTGGL